MANSAGPLSARSVVLSILLGTTPARLPIRRLIVAADLFDIAEGTVRTAVTRMVDRSEIHAEGDGWYQLGDSLRDRQQRQSDSRNATTTPWTGEWSMGLVDSASRTPAQRAALRTAMGRLRFGEQRDGVWLRPDNLAPDRLPVDRAVADAQCRHFSARPDADPVGLAQILWDLPSWNQRATELRRAMADVAAQIDGGPDKEGLAAGFVCSASVLRHFQADPLLPADLVGAEWQGEHLRNEFARFDQLYRRSLAGWFAVHDPRPRD